MAQGDVTVFEELADYLGTLAFDFDNDTIRAAIMTNGVVPTAADATPAFGDYTEVADGNGYTTKGEAVTVTWAEVAGVATLSMTGTITWSQNAAGFADGYYIVIYDDTLAGDPAICFYDMGGPVSLVAGDVTFTAGSGLIKITVSNP